VVHILRRILSGASGGRVAVGHVTQMSLLAPSRFGEITTRLANAGVAVTILPSTDLHLMGPQPDLVRLDANNPTGAIATLAQPLWGIKRGRTSFTRPPPELHRPATSWSPNSH
jgi:hypothetical protein